MIYDILVMASTLVTTAIASWYLGRYMGAVFGGGRIRFVRPLRVIERSVYRLAGVDETVEQGWAAYLASMLCLTVISVAVAYAHCCDSRTTYL